MVDEEFNSIYHSAKNILDLDKQKLNRSKKFLFARRDSNADFYNQNLLYRIQLNLIWWIPIAVATFWLDHKCEPGNDAYCLFSGFFILIFLICVFSKPDTNCSTSGGI